MAVSILIVDDDPNILDTATDILEDAGYNVSAAGTGATALEQLRATPADVALLDFNLPDATGVELAVQFKKIRPHLQILLMTGEEHVDLGPAQEAIHSVLTKPVSPVKLINVIRQIVEP